IKRLEKIVESIPQYSLPSYLFNRRRDRITGQDMHLIGSDLTFSTKQDVQHNIDIDSWTGYRHFYGQKVRGQRTRTTGRTGMAVGVLRKSILAKAGAGAPSAAAAQEASAAAKGPAGVAAPAGAPAAKGMPATAKGAGAPKEGAKAPGAAAGAAKPTEKKKEEKK
ncbi:30S ribosomal protein S13, partial [Candidatus Micrarchaeota archaeon CG11_big_fil_rev_8_21_14_0_20_47_5]